MNCSYFIKNIWTLHWSPLGSVICLHPFPVKGSGHGQVSSPTWYLIEVIGACAGGPIRRGITLLTTKEIAGLAVTWERSLKIRWVDTVISMYRLQERDNAQNTTNLAISLVAYDVIPFLIVPPAWALITSIMYHVGEGPPGMSVPSSSERTQMGYRAQGQLIFSRNYF